MIFIFLSMQVFGSDRHKSILRTIEWKEISNDNNVTVYTPTSYDHSTGLVPLKFKALLQFPISKVLSVLADDKRKIEWMPNLKEIRLLEKKSIQDFTVYYRYDAPWPFKDRDFIIENKSTFDLEKMTINVEIKSVSHKEDPSLGKNVRGTAHGGYSIIKISEENPNYTIVEMAFLNEFGGYIPNFITNLVQKKWPYDFMKNLKKQLSRKDIVILPEFNVKSSLIPKK